LHRHVRRAVRHSHRALPPTQVWKDDQPDRCQLSIDVKANACCVQCSPSDPHTIVVGSANHDLHMYDLRAPRDPLRTFKGHAKTISYVQFMPGGQELVSASTDSTVRLWSVSSSECVATYTGHVNEKNFVGLAAAGEFVACGSETNEVVVYYKPMSAPLLRYSLSPVEALLGESSGHFVTALRWKGEGQALLAANSQGHIWVLGLGQ
jgi:E3 ubiquitin-protein ligase RFWD2